MTLKVSGACCFSSCSQLGHCHHGHHAQTSGSQEPVADIPNLVTKWFKASFSPGHRSKLPPCRWLVFSCTEFSSVYLALKGSRVTPSLRPLTFTGGPSPTAVPSPWFGITTGCLSCPMDSSAQPGLTLASQRGCRHLPSWQIYTWYKQEPRAQCLQKPPGIHAALLNP